MQNAFQIKLKLSQAPEPEVDSADPYFGKLDENDTTLAEKRKRAREIYQEQVALVEQRKRDALLKRLDEQRMEDDMLHRTNKE